MTPLPAPLGAGGVTAWRLDEQKFAQDWNSGEGAFRVGGRWNSKGIRAVYCALDPSTAILEVAVHKTFRVLDIVPHVMTAIDVNDPASIHVIMPTEIPDPQWLLPGLPSAGQQSFGDALLVAHAFIAIPSAVSSHSWNLIFEAGRAAIAYNIKLQEPFALDTRLHSQRT